MTAPSSKRETSIREHCHAGKDGDCNWPQCPQLKDYQQYCPLAKADEEEWGDDL